MRIWPRSFRVEVRQRLVEQERIGLPHDRPAHRDALPLATGQVRRFAVQVLGELEGFSSLLHALADLFLGQPAAQSQREGDVPKTLRCGYKA